MVPASIGAGPALCQAGKRPATSAWTGLPGVDRWGIIHRATEATELENIAAARAWIESALAGQDGRFEPR